MKKKLLLVISVLLGILLFTGCPSPAETPTETPTTETPTGEPIRFNFNGTVGLALTQKDTVSFRSVTLGNRALDDESSSNLMGVDSFGNLSNILSSGKALISKFMIAPNNKLYILFSQKINLETSEVDYENGCLLGEVDQNTGSVTSIDSTLSTINWNDSDPNTYRNDPIQFDSNGAIYYIGNTSSGETVLRKFNSDISTDLVNDNIYITDFIVNDDGSVIVSGTTTSSNTQWIRKITTTGGLQNIVTSTEAQFLSKFQDDNIYMGIWGDVYMGVFRYLINSSSLDVNPWISGTAINNLTYTPYNDIATAPLLSGAWGSHVSNIIKTSNNKVYAKASSGLSYILMQYYPSLETPTTIITKVSEIQGFLSTLIISGLDSSNANKMVMYNTDLDTEEDLLNGFNIEVYHMNFVSSENKIMFDGLNFENNQMVLGEIDLITKDVNLITLGSGSSAQLLDFQTY